MRKNLWILIILCFLCPATVLSMDPEEGFSEKMRTDYYDLAVYQLSIVPLELRLPALLARIEQQQPKPPGISLPQQEKSTENSDSSHQTSFAYQIANGYHTAQCPRQACPKTFSIRTRYQDTNANKDVLRGSIVRHLIGHDFDRDTLRTLISGLDRELEFGKKTTQALTKLEEGIKRLQSIDPANLTTEQAKQFLSLYQCDTGRFFIECPLCPQTISGKKIREAWSYHLCRTQNHHVDGVDLGVVHGKKLLALFKAMELSNGVNKRKKEKKGKGKRPSKKPRMLSE